MQLPPDNKIHLVVHVSLLKQARPGNETAQPDLLAQCSLLEHALIPLQVLDDKDICAGNKFVHLVQVHWSELPASWTTWENEARLKKEFPNATSWGQAGIQDGGMSGAQRTHTEEA
jgi:hypothetical protein